MSAHKPIRDFPKACLGAHSLDRPRSATLELTLKRRWFDMVAAGEKKEEYRAPSGWILSRLCGNQYSRVRFRNGYSKTSPVVVCEYLGWETGHGKIEWGAGFDIVIIIKLGRVIESPNYLFRRKVFGLSAYWPRNAELLATALLML